MSTLLDRRPAEKSPEVVLRVTGDGRGGGGRRSFLSLAFFGVIVLAVVLFAGSVTGLLDLGDLFSSKTVDRSPPVLLKRLHNLSDYRAAQGEFLVTIDEEEDVPILPSFLAGESVVFNGVGTVDATVDFSKLSTDAVQVGPEDTVTITLPEPKLEHAVVDPVRSQVADRDRGLANRIGGAFEDDPTSERSLYIKAAKRLDRVASQSKLVERAERNVTAMLKGFLGRLGFATVNIRFVDAKAPEATTSTP